MTRYTRAQLSVWARQALAAREDNDERWHLLLAGMQRRTGLRAAAIHAGLRALAYT
ncbi:hypothetical protein UFOVP703_32 [uncultured Caudovirales phage]|uniref:Uncharacterized protein n=1 Tax=uncultured Caudovirales phage TaxID=2100421 RepID=A0A6J5NM40_9CAUD|nr:hypothetical protein UFOVP703_32 [uncultured Caudovirales phage]